MTGTGPAALSVHRRRSAARMVAVQVVYQGLIDPDLDLDDALRAALHDDIAGFALADEIRDDLPVETRVPLVPPDGWLFTTIVRGAYAEAAALDEMIAASLSRQWPMARLEPLVHAVLRAGAYELWRVTDSSPPAVIVKDFADVAGAFYPDGPEPGMVNAVLDRLAHALHPQETGPPGTRN